MELDELIGEMEALADHLEKMNEDIDPDVAAAMIRCLLDGWHAASIVEEFALDIDEDGNGV